MFQELKLLYQNMFQSHYSNTKYTGLLDMNNLY